MSLFAFVTSSSGSSILFFFGRIVCVCLIIFCNPTNIEQCQGHHLYPCAWWIGLVCFTYYYSILTFAKSFKSKALAYWSQITEGGFEHILLNLVIKTLFNTSTFRIYVNKMESSFKSTGILAWSWLFCMPNFSCLVSFWCMLGVCGGLNLIFFYIYQLIEGQTHSSMSRFLNRCNFFLNKKH